MVDSTKSDWENPIGRPIPFGQFAIVPPDPPAVPLVARVVSSAPAANPAPKAPPAAQNEPTAAPEPVGGPTAEEYAALLARRAAGIPPPPPEAPHPSTLIPAARPCRAGPE